MYNSTWLIMILIGILLLVIGILLLVREGGLRGKSEGGAVVVIGPLPIIVGTSRQAALIAAIIALIVLIIMLVFLYSQAW